MPNKPEIICLIPARGGSKGIPRKNVKLLGGKPLIAYSIEVAREARNIDRVVVSTDDEEIAAVAKEYGAEVPFIRPLEIAGDLTPDYPVFRHYVDFLDEAGVESDLVVHLRPTCPLRKAEIVDRAITEFRSVLSDGYTSLRSVSVPTETPFKMWTMENGELMPLLSIHGIEEPYNEPRQNLPLIFWQNGYVDIYRSSVIRNTSSCSGQKIRGFKITDKIFDLDYLSAFEKAEGYLNEKQVTASEIEYPG